MGTALVFLLVLVLALAWCLLGGRGGALEPTAHRRVDETIDYTELEQAERDVQDAPDEDGVRDWGPGIGRPPIA